MPKLIRCIMTQNSPAWLATPQAVSLPVIWRSLPLASLVSFFSSFCREGEEELDLCRRGDLESQTRAGCTWMARERCACWIMQHTKEEAPAHLLVFSWKHNKTITKPHTWLCGRHHVCEQRTVKTCNALSTSVKEVYSFLCQAATKRERGGSVHCCHHSYLL